MPASGTATLPSYPKSRFLEGLGPRALEVIRAAGTERRYLGKCVITNQGGPADHLFLLTGGRARHFFITQEGQKTLLLWLPLGEIFGGVAFLSKPKDA
jgi:hypothetical protein